MLLRRLFIHGQARRKLCVRLIQYKAIETMRALRIGLAPHARPGVFHPTVFA